MFLHLINHTDSINNKVSGTIYPIAEQASTSTIYYGYTTTCFPDTVKVERAIYNTKKREEPPDSGTIHVKINIPGDSDEF